MDLTAFAFEIKDGVAHITMNQPERGNPIDAAIRRGIRLARDRMLGAAGSARGAARRQGPLLQRRRRSQRSQPQPRGSRAFRLGVTSNLHMGISRFARMNAPVVAAVHGLAAGGAVALVAGADFVLASPDAKFYAAFAGIGIVSDSGGSYFLPRRMGSRRAAQFYMLNEMLSAEEAAASGLINKVVAAEALAAEACGARAAPRRGPDARLRRSQEPDAVEPDRKPRGAAREGGARDGAGDPDRGRVRRDARGARQAEADVRGR